MSNELNDLSRKIMITKSIALPYILIPLIICFFDIIEFLSTADATSYTISPFFHAIAEIDNLFGTIHTPVACMSYKSSRWLPRWLTQTKRTEINVTKSDKTTFDDLRKYGRELLWTRFIYCGSGGCKTEV
ncbi:uncharacterized protein LOC105282123 [Ooceraea biroi]|uniref:uncharacterized protein LOC105282123 n=1 Tax=Ooceraea biroi TaxID=2015173 RepID=UPI000F079A93|nr:uncharacterized protein LOC105282123 [Ooceraea biroi]